MAGFFTGTGSTRELGRVARALYNYGLGTTVGLYSPCWTYYGGGASNVQLSASFAGRYYPHTY
jgi:hypothetical protein